MSPHSSNERIVLEKGQEVIISYADTLRNVSTNRDLLSSMEKRTVSPFPGVGSMPVFVSSKKARSARGGGCCRRAAKGGEISVRVKFN